MKKRFLPGVLWMGDFDIILTFKKIEYDVGS